IVGVGGSGVSEVPGCYTVILGEATLAFEAGGTVFNASFGGPLANVTMTFTAVAGGGAVPSPVATDANGQWAQTGFAPGTTYRVTPSLPEYVFSPASLDFSAFAPG